MPRVLVGGLIALSLLVVGREGRAQAEFVNFETPQTKPIAIASFGTGAAARDFVLACNTPDNALWIYEAAPPHALVRRIPTGLGPGTVRYLPEVASTTQGRAYVCNFDGDSVSVIHLLFTAPNTLVATLERTVWVGDEPADIAFTSDNLYGLVTHSTRSSVSFFNIPSMVPMFLNAWATAPLPEARALKSPRGAAFLPGPTGDRWFVLNFLSDDMTTNNPPVVLPYDADMMFLDPQLPGAYRVQGGMGTTHHNFAVTADGTRLFVVGTRAKNDPRNVANRTEATVAQMPLGFVESHVWVVDCPPGVEPAVAPEAPRDQIGQGLPVPLWQSLNLNHDYTMSSDTPVLPADALAQPTDVVLIESGTPDNTPDALVITAFHSDLVAFLEPDNNVDGGWAITRVPLHAVNTSLGYSMIGPRGLAYSKVAADPGSAAGLVFVMNRLDNSISIVNPHTKALAATGFFRMQDPTPRVIREGREFLYGAKHSGSKIVSCASCHMDGRTDGLGWDLSSPTDTPAIPSWANDAHGLPGPPTNFPTPKGVMVTQTLQGLVEFPIEGPMQIFATSAPYHWRGDRGVFQDFNGAFSSLLSGPGLSTTNMDKYTAFINTIVHPPNPEQPLDRSTPGVIDAVVSNPRFGSSELFGQQLYHTVSLASMGQRACVDCHSLPDGSNSRLTLITTPNLFVPVPFSPMETAEIRNVFQREAFMHTSINAIFAPGNPPSMAAWPDRIKGVFGLLHEGQSLPGGAPFSGSIDSFLSAVFGLDMPGPAGNPDQELQIEAIIQYVRHLDSGVAPAIGYASTWTPTTSGGAANTFNILENQANEANLGLIAYTRNGTTERGYYWDVLAQQYREEGTANLVSRATLLTNSLVIAQATPVGSERRMANLSGVKTATSGAIPTNVVLQPMAPMTANNEIWKFFRWSFADIRALNNGNLFPSTNILYELTRSLATAGYGISSRVLPDNQTYQATEVSEPPRRFRVSADNLRHGAFMVLGVPRQLPPTTNIDWGIFPLFPTNRFDANNRRIWETAVEIDVKWQLVFMNGGPYEPNMLTQLYGNPMSTGLVFDHANWNRYHVQVFNEDLTPVPVVTPWPRLTVQTTR